jgi:NADH-quinone oxidoreductase subunit M
LWLYQRTAFGTPSEEFAGQSDAEHHTLGGGHGHVAHSLSSAANDDLHHDEHDDIHDVGLIEWIAWSPFLIAIVVFGVYPQLMFKIFDPAVTEMVTRLGTSLGK